MKTVEITLCKFAELSEEAKEKAIEKLYDINVTHEWWEFVYEDAEQIGLKLTEFDLNHFNISGNLTEDPKEVKKLIMSGHGKNCDIYKYVQGFDMRTEIDENEFKYGLLQEYLSILSKEYEYLTSEASIIESIEANEYDFTENGEIY